MDEALKSSPYAVVCITKENVKQPWINFEVGAIFGKLEKSKVALLLIDVMPSEVQLPLSKFQMTRLNERADFLELFKSLGKNTGSSLNDIQLVQCFNSFYDTNIDAINTILDINEEPVEKEESAEEYSVYQNYISGCLEEIIKITRNLPTKGDLVRIASTAEKTENQGSEGEKYDFVSYRTIYDTIYSVSRATLKQWVDEGKVASRKDGTSQQHGRTYNLEDVKRCWNDLKDDIND